MPFIESLFFLILCVVLKDIGLIGNVLIGKELLAVPPYPPITFCHICQYCTFIFNLIYLEHNYFYLEEVVIMSLTTMLQYDDEWKSFFKQCIPAKTDFKTLSGHLAFSNEYEELAEYSLSNRYYSNVVGTAFDYIARWIIAKNVPSNNFSACEDLIAEWALETCTTAANEQNIDIEDTYKSAIGKCKKFIEGNGTKNEIIDIAILFAKLEQIFRSPTNGAAKRR